MGQEPTAIIDGEPGKPAINWAIMKSSVHLERAASVPFTKQRHLPEISLP